MRHNVPRGRGAICRGGCDSQAIPAKAGLKAGLRVRIASGPRGMLVGERAASVAFGAAGQA
jgi:hypothetical protein